MTKNRFRFRAWDESFRRMTYDIFFFWKKNEITVYELEEDASKSYLPNSHIVLEQCTGLKDKNGKLIYEGDIVKVAHLSTNLPVGYHQKFATFELTSNRYFADLYGSDANLEVIGNVHENPELLEENNGK